MTRAARYLSDIRSLPADAALGYRLEGVSGAWKALACRSVHRVIRSGRLIVFAHALRDAVQTRLPAGVRITKATERQLSALNPMVGGRELEQFSRLLANGRHCLVAWRAERPVGYAWVAESIGPDVAIWPLPFKIPSDAAYLWNLYVLPSERGSGIGTALAEARLQLTRELGFREGWRMVAPSNTASLRIVAKSCTGTRVIGELAFISLLGRTRGRFIPHPRTPAEIE